MERPYRVLFVCLGNICRSALAEGVLRQRLAEAGLAAHVEVSSAGTGDWHVGKPPDRRMCATAKARGVELSHQRARQLRAADLRRNDLVLAMDRDNLANARALAPDEAAASRLRLFREFDPVPENGEVPDPYYGGDEGFVHVFEIVDRTCRALVDELRRRVH
ncbi:MAG TPA: low molecular weight protein-tyrosine-phosphatase [Vulgatibacter sp.]